MALAILPEGHELHRIMRVSLLYLKGSEVCSTTITFGRDDMDSLNLYKGSLR